MKQRPLLFVIIGALHLMEPLFKILYFKITTNFGFQTIISNISSISGPLELFKFWFMFPIAGLALLGVKRWSYPIFVGVQLFSIYDHLTYKEYAWPYVSKYPFVTSLALLAVNIGIIIYFALPKVRQPFFDKELRWWEHRERFNFPIPCALDINNPNKLIDTHILNISHSGAFIAYNGVLDKGNRIKVNFEFDGHYISLEAEMISHHSFDNRRGIGVKFIYENIWENLAMRKAIKSIARASKQKERQLQAAA